MGNNVAETGNLAAKNINNVEATFDIVERIVQHVAFDNVAWTLLLVWTGLKDDIRCFATAAAVQVDDEFRCHDYESNRLEKPHRNLPMLGPRLRAYVAEPPPTSLVGHWQRRLEVAPPRYAELGDQAPHVCLFPLQDLRPELHAVDPDEHYHVYSKAFITEIDCPQAAVLNQLKTPAVLKVRRRSCTQ